MEDRSGRFDPVVHKNRLHLRDDWTFGLIVTLAPMRFVLRIAEPLASHSHAARESDPAINDQELAMSAVVQTAEV
jgi:hypothetical protein